MLKLLLMDGLMNTQQYFTHLKPGETYGLKASTHHHCIQVNVTHTLCDPAQCSMAVALQQKKIHHPLAPRLQLYELIILSHMQ